MKKNKTKKKEIVMMNLFVLVDRFSFPSTEPTCLKSGADLIIPVLAITLGGDLAPFQPGSCSVCQPLFFFFFFFPASVCHSGS